MESEAPSFLFTLAAFIIGFGLLVFIHEWGHYAMARLFGVKIDSFAIGFGQELLGRTDRHGVRWKLCAIPLGGYVKFAGDRSAASAAEEGLDQLPEEQKREIFHFKPLYQRALIVAAGPAINLLAGVFVFAGFFLMLGMQTSPAEVGRLVEGGPAIAAGLNEGDKILAIDGESVTRFSDIGEIVKLRPGQLVDVSVERFGEILTIPVELATRYMEDRFGNRYAFGVLGIYSGQGEIIQPGPFTALYEGARATYGTVNSIFTTLGQMITGLRSIEEAGGPIRIGTMMGDAANQGFDRWVLLLAMISINLGVVNLLPIPMLDGGHLFFYTIEAIKGSPVSDRVMGAGYYAGAALMLLLMAFVTLNDLQSILL